MSHHVEKNTLKNIADACRVFISVIRPLIRSCADVMSAREAMSKFEPCHTKDLLSYMSVQFLKLIPNNMALRSKLLKVAVINRTNMDKGWEN